MPLTVERLRTWILVAGGVLVLVLGAFFYLAHWKQRFLTRDLPKKLGVDIQQDSSGFTLSKSHNGKTLFTLHASRAVQLKNEGNAQLHDVKIVIYGQGASQRQDRISGDAFAYDPKTQIVQAQGEVLIDLQSPDAGAAGKPANQQSTIHLRTRGLVFNQNTGVAVTTQAVDFRLPQAAGTAVGAEYDSQQGLVTLQSQVVLHTVLDDQPATVIASHAVMNRQTWQINLTSARLHNEKRDASADSATLWMHPDGAADHMLAEGHVVMTTADGTELDAPRGTAQFRADSRVEHVHVDGGVKMHQTPPDKTGVVRDGQAEQAWLDLDAKSKPTQLRMQGGVHLVESVAGAAPAQRELHAGHADVAFRDGVAQQIVAKESPMFQETATAKQRKSTKLLQADTLEATLRGGKLLDQVHGIGNTQLTQQESTGEVDISHGDDLVAKFGAAEGSAMTDGPQQIVSAVQQGNVRFNRTLPATKPAAGSKSIAAAGVEKSTGHAARAEYRQADETTVLTGDPRLTDTSPDKAVVDLVAQRITLHRSSGDALAEGAVKSSYVSEPGAATAHVVGDRAVLSHAQQTATFTGSPRLWQDGNSVEAPTLVLTDKPRGLLAESGAEGPPAVHAVFVQHDPKHPQPPVRVTSRTLVYSDAERKARFTNGVTLVDSNGTVRADKMDVFLKSAPPNGPATNPAMNHAAAAAGAPMGGQVDHILATGDVFLDQPLRQGTGEELLYTADDGKFVLTGSAKRPPRIEDKQKGTVTGDALVFLSRDSKVDVENGPGRTVTTTRLSNKGESK